MAMHTGNGAAIFTPEEVADLLITPLTAAAVATQDNVTATVVATQSHVWRVPMVTDDPAADWIAEGAEIAPSDATLAELEVTPRKLAGLTIVTNELLADTSEEAKTIIGDGLVRDIARKLDAAFVGNLGGNAPAGLGSIAPTLVAGESLDNLDAFAMAVSAAEQNGAAITSWVTNPATALELALLKDSDGSNATLLGTDPTQPTRRIIEGRPVVVSPDVPERAVYGLPADRVYTLIRSDADVVADSSAFFTSDRTAIRATLRAAFAFPHPDAVVRIDFTAPTP